MAAYRPTQGIAAMVLWAGLGSSLQAGQSTVASSICRPASVEMASLHEDPDRFESLTHCLTCHDGMLATEVHDNEAADIPRFDREHPVDVIYETAYGRHPARYHPPGRLDVRLVLADGRVQCTTCHDLASPRSAKLVITTTGSRLCLECHRL